MRVFAAGAKRIVPGIYGLPYEITADQLSLIDEAPLVNVVRRPGCPLVVRCDDGRKLEEGVHFRPVRDERMHELADRGDFEVYHDPPVIEFLPAAALADGAIVRARQPEAGLCVWSDMFDPHHNARDAFYLVNGTLA